MFQQLPRREGLHVIEVYSNAQTSTPATAGTFTEVAFQQVGLDTLNDIIEIFGNRIRAKTRCLVRAEYNLNMRAGTNLACDARIVKNPSGSPIVINTSRTRCGLSSGIQGQRVQNKTSHVLLEVNDELAVQIASTANAVVIADPNSTFSLTTLRLE